MLAAGLRPDAFFAGDPGVKLIAARSAAAHPSRPFDVALPVIGDGGGQPVTHVEPFFGVHGDHAHAITSELFPLLTAPLLGAFGIRGAYVLPAAGFLAALWAISALGATLDGRRSPTTIVAVAALTSPLLFYGLELWEHTLAVAAGAAGAVVFLRGRALAAGLLFGVAVLLRPEAAWFAVASGAAALLTRTPRPFGQLALALAGAALALAPMTAWTFVHFGALLPPHIASNAALVGQSWIAERLEYARVWFGPESVGIWRTMPALVAAAVLSTLMRDGSRLGGRAFLWTVAAIDAALVLATSPNDGGAQWSPRYLLFVSVPLSILAADAVTDLLRRRRAAPIVVAAVVLAAGGWIQRDAYRVLRGTKASYGQLVDFVDKSAAASPYVVTDIWWLDQALAAKPRLIFLFADLDLKRTDLMRRLAEAHVGTITLVTARRSDVAPDRWTNGTCFEETDRTELPRHDVAAMRLSCQ